MSEIRIKAIENVYRTVIRQIEEQKNREHPSYELLNCLRFEVIGMEMVMGLVGLKFSHEGGNVSVEEDNIA